jgi:DNA-binding GntR family transcriptional regulator
LANRNSWIDALRAKSFAGDLMVKKNTSAAKFWEKYKRYCTASLPKYVQLRDCILAAIREGLWKQGDRLPTEMELARVTDFSLGTVQNAYRNLVQDGTVERRKGRAGSFVSREVKSVDTVWHFLFSDERHENTFLVFPQIDRIQRHSSRGSWNLHLTWVDSEVVQIDRIIDIGREFLVFSQFVIDAREYDRARKGKTGSLEGNNLRRELNLNVIQMTHDLRIEEIPPIICGKIGIPAKSTGLVIESRVDAVPQTQGYFLRMFVPPTKFWLRISSNLIGAPKRALPAELEQMLC